MDYLLRILFDLLVVVPGFSDPGIVMEVLVDGRMDLEIIPQVDRAGRTLVVAVDLLVLSEPLLRSLHHGLGVDHHPGNGDAYVLAEYPVGVTRAPAVLQVEQDVGA